MHQSSFKIDGGCHFISILLLRDDVSSLTLLGHEWHFIGDDVSSRFLLGGDRSSLIIIDGRRCIVFDFLGKIMYHL